MYLGVLLIGITTNESLRNIIRNIIFLKIDKNDLSIMDQIKLSASGGGSSQIVLMNIFPTSDGQVMENFLQAGILIMEK